MKKHGTIKLILLVFALINIFYILNTKANASDDDYENGLVAYYPFDGNANDMSGNGNHGSITSSVNFDLGLDGLAANFQGMTNPGYIYIPNSTSLQFYNECTFVFFAKLTTITGMDESHQASDYGLHCVFAKSHDNSGFYSQLVSSSSKKLTAKFMNNEYTSPKFSVTEFAKKYEIGTWLHIAFVLTQNTGSAYVNGTNVNTKSGTIDFNTANSEDLYFGAFSDFLFPFNGLIDDVRIYNRALSTEEIQTLYEQPFPPKISPIADQITLEDTATAPINFSITDTNTNPDDLTLTAYSSSLTIVAIENIEITGSGQTKTLIITPTANESGLVTITIMVSDGMLTALTEFILTVTPVNDTPVISKIYDHTIDEGTSTNPIPFTIFDVDSIQYTVSASSSNQNLITDENITITGNGNNYSIIINPETYQTGYSTISLTASDGIDHTSTNFTITVDEVYYTISGHISYYTGVGNTSVSNVLLSLTGTYSYSTVTDLNGDYAINIRPGNYTLTPSKHEDGSIGLNDALSILKAVAKLINLDCYSQIAADVNMNKRLTSLDASKLAIKASNMIPCMNQNCTKWKFLKSSISDCQNWPPIKFQTNREYQNLNSDMDEQNFIGIMLGNVRTDKN